MPTTTAMPATTTTTTLPAMSAPDLLPVRLDSYDRRLARWVPCGTYVPRAERIAAVLDAHGLALGAACDGHVLFLARAAFDGIVRSGEMMMVTRDPTHHRAMPLREALLAIGCIPA